MKKPCKRHFQDSVALLTDLYELTMAYAYWKSGTANKEAVFNLSFRENPFKGGFAIACGLSQIIACLDGFHFSQSDIAYLATIKGSDKKPLFANDFLKYLSTLRFDCDIDAVPEGTVVFAHEPLLRVKGPIIPCQILETILLNIISFQTLIATKAARLRLAAGKREIVEFGSRRAQGPDGALSASWAALVGGCDATSNVLAGKEFGVPVKGTHAHSWVMSFDDERTAFKAYAEALPNNCVFLVDTYDTLEGVRHAIEVGKMLRRSGHDLLGIRLDSGDLAYLSIEARQLLDANGFPDAQVVASNDLDEQVIKSLNDQGARIDVWGVGTKLITAYDQPALGGVYKLCAVREPEGDWQYKVKLSEQVAKINHPGIQQVRRFQSKATSSEYYMADMIYDEQAPPLGSSVVVDPVDFTRRKAVPENTPYEDLLKPIMRKGEVVYEFPSLTEIKNYSMKQLSLFHPGIKRLLNPHQYPVGLEQSLHTLKTELILKARQAKTEEPSIL